MTKIDGNYLVTDDDSVKVLFIGKPTWYLNPAKKKFARLSKKTNMAHLGYAAGLACSIHRDFVLEAIETAQKTAADLRNFTEWARG